LSVSGRVDAIVEVGRVLAADPLAPVDVADEALEAGAGETIDTGVVELEGDEVVDAGVDASAAGEDDDLAEAGLELSLGTPLANGSRAMRASTTLTGSSAGAWVVVVVWLDVAPAAGGAGGSAVPPADPPLSRRTGMATRATIRSATTGQSLRSTRSRRSALILVLQ
jgi:hypothetical protein